MKSHHKTSILKTPKQKYAINFQFFFVITLGKSAKNEIMSYFFYWGVLLTQGQRICTAFCKVFSGIPPIDHIWCAQIWPNIAKNSKLVFNRLYLREVKKILICFLDYESFAQRFIRPVDNNGQYKFLTNFWPPRSHFCKHFGVIGGSFWLKCAPGCAGFRFQEFPHK